MRFTQVCPCVNKRVSRLRGVNVSCIHLSCQENCWQVVNSMGKLMFVSDNRNQLIKLENFRKCFLSVRKRNRMTAFFLNKRNLLERELSTQYSERKRFVPNQSLETWFVKGFSKRRTIVIKPWSDVLQSFTKIIFRSIFVWVCVLFDTYLQKSFRRCQLLWKSAFVYGQILSIWLNMWIPTFTELGWQAKLKTLVLAALLKLLIGFLSYALIRDYLDSCVQLHGWTVECKLTTETLGVSCSQTTAQYKLTE